MKTVFEQLARRLEEKKRTVLAVTVGGSGSRPRAEGAYMLVGEEGRLWGTVGGGNLEYQSIGDARGVLESGTALVKEYGTGQGDGLDMVCGGSETVLLTCFSPDVPGDIAFAEQGLAACRRRMPYRVVLPLDGGGAWICPSGPVGPAGGKSGSDPAGAGEGKSGSGPVGPAKGKSGSYAAGAGEGRSEDHLISPAGKKSEILPSSLRAYLSQAGGRSVNREIHSAEGRSFYVEQFGCDGRVYLLGGGHLAQETVPVLARLGFRCVVADDREEFASRSLFPEAEEVLLVSFDHLEDYLSIFPGDYIAVMTRGHACDLEAERFALKTEAGYIGVVGSRAKTAYVNGKLKEEGFTEEELNRVYAPIGLEIGSETPAEIAVSIAAQLIKVRAAKEGRQK